MATIGVKGLTRNEDVKSARNTNVLECTPVANPCWYTVSMIARRSIGYWRCIPSHRDWQTTATLHESIRCVLADNLGES